MNDNMLLHLCIGISIIKNMDIRLIGSFKEVFIFILNQHHCLGLASGFHKYQCSLLLLFIVISLVL